MSDLTFDRAAAGIIANGNWKDAEEFGRISGTVLNLNLYSVAQSLPEGDNSGVTALRGSGCLITLRNVLGEFGDACAILGSGTEETIKDFDSTEYVVTQSYQRMERRLNSGGMMPV